MIRPCIFLASWHYILKLNSEFKDGAHVLSLREAAYVTAQLLTDHFACVEADSRTTFGLVKPGYAVLDLSKWFEKAALVAFGDAWPLVFHDHREQRSEALVMPRLLDRCAGYVHLYLSVWRVELDGV